jgi:hypothetical protein
MAKTQASPPPSPPVPLDEAAYEAQARAEMAAWRAKVMKGPGILDHAARGVQGRINRIIPEKVHQVITVVIEKMTRAIMSGSDYVAPAPLEGETLSAREAKVRDRLGYYRAAAAAEGGVAGAGGFLLAAADFPVLIVIKIKLLFDIAALYGHRGEDVRERLYILSIFQLAFSSPWHRNDVFEAMQGWDAREGERSYDGFDWRSFQQQYRDYIDLAKLAQLLPVIGAPVGAVVNYGLLDRLGKTAMNAYRMRWFADRED